MITRVRHLYLCPYRATRSPPPFFLYVKKVAMCSLAVLFCSWRRFRFVVDVVPSAKLRKPCNVESCMFVCIHAYMLVLRHVQRPGTSTLIETK